MIDARRVATLGLGAAVDPVMVATLGLWPVQQVVQQLSLGWGSFPGHGSEYEPWRDVRQKPAKPRREDIALPALLPSQIEAVRREVGEADDDEALLLILLTDQMDDFS